MSRLRSWRALFASDHGEHAQVVLDDLRAMADPGIGGLIDQTGRMDPLRLAMKEGALQLVAAVERRIKHAADEHKSQTPVFARTSTGEHDE